ncbi:hypothetical protein LJB84_02700, partial [Bacteroidales bacterium OttesenSCG-928-J19]|nr:hypothetical protein [Bacteroidales bacterium OttesenSCG-928-J19]
LKLYQQLLDYRLSVPVMRFTPRDPQSKGSGQRVDYSRQATLMVDLDRLDFVRTYSQGESSDSLYLAALEHLKKDIGHLDYSIEVLYKEAEYYISKTYEGFEDEQIAYKKKAYKICLEGIDRFPDYERIGLLKNILRNLTETRIDVRTGNSVYPGKDLELKLSFSNAGQATLEIYRIEEQAMNNNTRWDRSGLYEKYGKLVQEQELKLQNDQPYLSYDTIIRIPMQEPGFYEYVIRTAGTSKIANQAFSVTRLATFSRILNNKREFLVCDALTGKPIEGAAVKLYKPGKRDAALLADSQTTNHLGIAQTTGSNEARYYSVEYGDDKFLMSSSVPQGYSWNYRSDNAAIRLGLFTDRSIYRPGQTVYLKGIATEDKPLYSEVVPNREYTLSFRDTNGKELATQTLRTNEFGSFAAEFIIPQGLLNGAFSIRADKDNAMARFSVEEYKRPTFEMEFLPIEKTYHFGDTIVVRGLAKTFSGVNLQDTEVNYTVSRQSHWLFRRWFNPEQVASGTIRTKSDDGSFEIRFPAEKTFIDRDKKDIYYTYSIEATVTHSNGESQTASRNVSVGDKAMILDFAGWDGDFISSLDGLRIVATNLDGANISTEGTFQIFRLKPGDELQEQIDSDKWETEKSIYTGRFKSNEEVKIALKKLPASGRYRIVAKAKDDRGNEVEASRDFTIATMNDKRPPVPTYQWMMVPVREAAVGETVEIVYGSSAKDVYVLYEIFCKGEKVEASRFILNNENRTIKLPYQASYGDGISVQFTFVKDKQFFSRELTITKKRPNKQLKLTMTTFRDRLLPGQQEEWKIAIRDADKNPVLAELLAGMYDASLDKIRPHSWRFNPLRSVYIGTHGLQAGQEFRETYDNLVRIKKRVDVPSYDFSTFNWFGFGIGRNLSNIRIRGGASYSNRAVEGGSKDRVYVADLQDHKVIVPVEYGLQEREDVVGSVYRVQEEAVLPEAATVPTMKETVGAAQPVQIRENFNETAFFYPQLRTNEQGETLISFTVPESNTTWNFLALAHTKDLKFGQLTKQAISQKMLMVSPNMPRFLREGDRTTLTTTIANLSEETLSGEVSLECFDPNTGKRTIVVDQASQSFFVKPGKTVPVSWSFLVPSGIDMTAIKVVAVSPTHSDGEQHLIPILPNRMLVTESLPMNVRGNESKTFSFDKLLKNSSTTLENYRLTLEFTGNPIWYAVQALPSMQEPQSDNAVAWFNAFYANSLAVHIANSTPKLKAMIDTWTRQGGNKETLISNLEKNAELKAILLEETPWVMQAENETEQKQRLALLFDLNRNTNLNRTALDKLRATQGDDGGWSWFPGMRSSTGISQYILYGIGNLKHLGALSKDGGDIASLQEKAIRFVDYEFGKYFENWKRYDEDWKKAKSLSTYTLEYLYVRSLFPEVEVTEKSAVEATDFYLSVLTKYWTNQSSLYERSLAAVILKRNSQEKTAKAIVKSLREHAVWKDELGMYWANNKAYCFFFQSATITHTFLMEAFREVGSSQRDMDEMKLWLLKQKQTQVWESTPATALAVNILLKTGTNWLDSPGDVNIQMGKHSLSTATGETGTGYIKESFTASDITPEMGKVSVNKVDEGPAWGAMYWQYFEDLDKITSAKTELNVEKSLFIEETSATGKTLVPAENIQVGDKVTVRLVVRVDRDMEYVLLKDMRAACLEPADQLSALRWKEQVVYYQSSKDASTNFYFYNLPKGTYVFEYSLYATSPGEYSTGNATIQCLYAPEYISHTAGKRITVNSK